jgi:hypothetical protein
MKQSIVLASSLRRWLARSELRDEFVSSNGKSLANCAYHIIADLDKKSTVLVGDTYKPFVLDERHCGLNPLRCPRLAARNLDQAEFAEPSLSNAMALRESPHVAVDRDEDRIVCFGNRAHELVRRTRRNRLAEVKNLVPSALEGFAYGIGNAFIKKQAQNGPAAIQAAKPDFEC